MRRGRPTVMTATTATQSTECVELGGVGVAPKVFTSGVTPRTKQMSGGEALARSPNSISDHSVDYSVVRAGKREARPATMDTGHSSPDSSLARWLVGK